MGRKPRASSHSAVRCAPPSALCGRNHGAGCCRRLPCSAASRRVAAPAGSLPCCRRPCLLVALATPLKALRRVVLSLSSTLSWPYAGGAVAHVRVGGAGRRRRRAHARAAARLAEPRGAGVCAGAAVCRRRQQRQVMPASVGASLCPGVRLAGFAVPLPIAWNPSHDGGLRGSSLGRAGRACPARPGRATRVTRAARRRNARSARALRPHKLCVRSWAIRRRNMP